MEALKLEATYYTYEDLLKMERGLERYELIDGVIQAMASPKRWHQEIVGEIFGQLRDFLKGKKCKVYISPFDVRLNFDDEDDIVVQPDVLVICDLSKLVKDGQGCKGAPDIVVEVLSPSTSFMDRIVKFRKYEQAGVPEYWIVDSAQKSITIYRLTNGEYKNKTVYTDAAVSQVLEGCVIDLAEVFPEE